MHRRLALVVVLFSGILATTHAVTKTTAPNDPSALTVHEWGTFTSVANADGTPAPWQPLNGASDLPCFVERIRMGIKGDISGTVRMETPVLYLYAAQDTNVDVSVRFRQGLVTEWFPRAAVTPNVLNAGALRVPDVESRITWKNVSVRPRAPQEYPAEAGPSHYYAARATDASPIESGSQKEKFLFYRGVGSFAPPVAAAVRADGTVDVRTTSGDPVGDVILFENRRGAIGFRAGHGVTREIALRPPVLERRGLASLSRELERVLVTHGLYRKEAAAMVATWKDAWFEEGTRLFYIAPARAIDAILPLEITPAPAQVARVFVGRVELVTPRTIREVEDAILQNDGATFAKYERFMQPIAARVLDSSPAERSTWERRIKAAHQSYYAGLKPTRACK